MNDAVLEKAERLRTTRPSVLEATTAVKRQAWFRSRFPDGIAETTPRRAYEVFCFDYLGLDPADVPVAAESPQEIVWLSKNPCPTLDACVASGLDTRKVCRGVYEKSTQALVSSIDPRLRFLREYEEIRPHAPHCRERIVRVDFDVMMGIALEEARISRSGGDKGYGAVVALGTDVVSHCHDTAGTSGDPSRHAEMDALRAAAAKLGTGNLSGCILYATCEPCPMCAAMAVWCNVSAIVFGASVEETAALGRTRIGVPCRQIVAAGPALIEVIGGVRREECLALYR